MLPKPSLPDTAFAARDARIAAPLVFRERPCEPALDQLPPHREVAIVWRQGPGRMQMIGQHDEGIDRERMIALQRLMQQLAVASFPSIGVRSGRVFRRRPCVSRRRRPDQRRYRLGRGYSRCLRRCWYCWTGLEGRCEREDELVTLFHETTGIENRKR